MERKRQIPDVRALLVLLLALCCSAPATAAGFQDLELVRQAVREFVFRENGGLVDPEHVDVGLIDPRLRLAPCHQQLHVFFADGSRAAGTPTVGVRCLGPASWLIYVPTRVKLYREVLIMTRALPRKAVIERADLKLVRRDVSGLNAGYLDDVGDAVGRVTKRPLVVGAIVDPGALDRQRLVRRGDKVVIRARFGGLNVQMKGKALMDGSAGSRVKVKNLSSGRIVEGLVSAGGTIEVHP